MVETINQMMLGMGTAIVFGIFGDLTRIPFKVKTQLTALAAGSWLEHLAGWNPTG